MVTGTVPLKILCTIVASDVLAVTRLVKRRMKMIRKEKNCQSNDINQYISHQITLSMERVQQELSTAIKTNFAMLGLNIADPSVVCNCSITPGGNSPLAPAPAVTSSGPTAASTIASQFVAGGSTLSTADLALNTVDPGNAPFILPVGQTADSIVAAQQTDAQKALEIATAAADAAAKKLATTATVTVTSTANSSTGAPTSASVTSSPNTVATPTTMTIAPYATDSTAATASTPAGIIESFAPYPSKRFHTMAWEDDDYRDNGGWGLCGRLTGSHIIFLIISVVVAWYVMKTVRARGV